MFFFDGISHMECEILFYCFIISFFGPPPTIGVWIERVNPIATPLERPRHRIIRGRCKYCKVEMAIYG